jgi:hypothetical protein
MHAQDFLAERMTTSYRSFLYVIEIHTKIRDFAPEEKNKHETVYNDTDFLLCLEK